MKKRTKVILIIAAVIVVMIIVRVIAQSISAKHSSANAVQTTMATDIPDETGSTETTVTGNMYSDEELAAIVSQMVEQQLAERLAEESTHVTEVTVGATETTVAEGTFAVSASPSGEFEAKLYHKGSEYEIPLFSSKEESEENAFYISAKGRNFTVSVDSDIISNVYATNSFRSSNGPYVPSEEVELEISYAEGQTSFSYEISDNPYGGRYAYGEVSVIMVFRLETTNGDLYFTVTY